MLTNAFTKWIREKVWDDHDEFFFKKTKQFNRKMQKAFFGPFQVFEDQIDNGKRTVRTWYDGCRRSSPCVHSF